MPFQFWMQNKINPQRTHLEMISGPFITTGMHLTSGVKCPGKEALIIRYARGSVGEINGCFYIKCKIVTCILRLLWRGISTQ